MTKYSVKKQGRISSRSTRSRLAQRRTATTWGARRSTEDENNLQCVCGAFVVLFGASGEGGLRSPQKREPVCGLRSTVCGRPPNGTFHNGALGGPNSMLRHRMCTTGNLPSNLLNLNCHLGRYRNTHVFAKYRPALYVKRLGSVSLSLSVKTLQGKTHRGLIAGREHPPSVRIHHSHTLPHQARKLTYLRQVRGANARWAYRHLCLEKLTLS